MACLHKDALRDQGTDWGRRWAPLSFPLKKEIGTWVVQMVERLPSLR